MVPKLGTLLLKNFRSYTRFEILIYLSIPLIMYFGMSILDIHRTPDEDPKGSSPDMFTSLYAAIDRLNTSNRPNREIRVHIAESKKSSQIIKDMENELGIKLKTNIGDWNEDALMFNELENGNYIAGIDIRPADDNCKVIMYFPTVLRSDPTRVWDFTDDKAQKLSEVQSDSLNEGIDPVVRALANALQKAYQVTAHNHFVRLKISPMAADNEQHRRYEINMRNESGIIISDDDSSDDGISVMGLISAYLPLFMTSIYSFPFIRLIMHQSRERSKQQTDIMSMAKVSRTIQYASWFFTTFFILNFINLMSIFFYKFSDVSWLKYSDFWGAYVFFTIWGICGIVFCFFIHSLCKSMILAVFVFSTVDIASFILHRYLQPHSLRGNILFYMTFQLGMLSGIKRIIVLETEQKGLQLIDYFKKESHKYDPVVTYLREKTTEIDKFWMFGLIPLCMLLGASIFLILCIVFELIYPGKYGIPIMRSKRGKYTQSSGQPGLSPTAVVQTYKLCGPFKNKSKEHKIRDFSMRIYGNEITVILGISGSGKSSVVNLITGSFVPQSGWICVQNKHVRQSRQLIGLTPQHDSLYSALTVNQHMSFFSSLRGQKASALNEKCLKDLNLWEVKSVRCRNLSDSDKQMLSVACAFAGQPPIVILDEPSERLSPYDRRLLWNFLLSEKRKRNIIITTYHIEEADALGDRFAILCDGRLVFNGTSSYLKNTYGSGYNLVCRQSDLCLEEPMATLITKHVPQINIASENPKEIAYRVPQENCMQIFPLLCDLEAAANHLNVDSIGVGTTSILDKFVNATLPDKTECLDECDLTESLHTESLYRGRKLCCNQLKALIFKKALVFKYNWFLLCAMLLGILFAYSGLHARRYIVRSHKPQTIQQNGTFTYWIRDGPIQNRKTFDIDPAKFKSSIFLYNTEDTYCNKKFSTIVRELIEKKYGFQSKQINNDDLRSYELDHMFYWRTHTRQECQSDFKYSRKYRTASLSLFHIMLEIAVSGYLKAHCYISPSCVGGAEPYQLKPFTLQMKTYKSYKQKFVTETISAVNEKEYKNVCEKDIILYAMIMSIHIFAGYFLATIIREKRIGFKLLQQVEGVNMATYWIVHLIWDWFCLFLLSAAMVFLSLILLPSEFKIVFVAYLAILILFCLALLPFLYVAALFLTQEVYGWLFSFLIFSVSLLAQRLLKEEMIFRYVFHVFPTYTAITALCSFCAFELGHRFCKFVTMPGCDDDKYGDTFDNWKPFYVYLILLCIAFIIYYLILLSSERFDFKRSNRSRPNAPDTKKLFSIKKSSNPSPAPDDNILILENIKAKHYKQSLDGISFTLKPMDVLGLIGKESGKSVINRAIFSLTRLTAGNILVNSIDAQARKMNKYKAYKYMGYCPQVDCFETQFTGRENLKILSLLRGMSLSTAKLISEELSNGLNFRNQLNRRASQYTMSDKRKLSIAIALIGTPPIIILDEPTEGIEKSHRSDVLDVLKSATECGSAILLSTNNIEDIQSICTKMAVVDNGSIMRVGSLQSFRNPVRGFVVHMRIRQRMIKGKRTGSIDPIEESQVHAIMSVLAEYFENVYLIENHKIEIVIYINSDKNISLANVYEIIERNRQALGISDYFAKTEDVELALFRQNIQILR